MVFKTLMPLVLSLLLTGCGGGSDVSAPSATMPEQGAIADNMDANSFQAALLGEWKSAWQPTNRPYVSHMLITRDNASITYVSNGTKRTVKGRYSVAFTRPPRPNCITLADVTIAPETGDSIVLSRVHFGFHSAVFRDQLLLRIDRSPVGTGVLTRAMPQ